jgi:hypothetical protein
LPSHPDLETPHVLNVATFNRQRLGFIFLDYLQELHPDGVWIGSSFVPNGIPTGGETPGPEL